MILITGATGKSGSATANELFKLGASYRALIRNPEKENPREAALWQYYVYIHRPVHVLVINAPWEVGKCSSPDW